MNASEDQRPSSNSGGTTAADGEVYNPFDYEYFRDLNNDLWAQITDGYFRPRLIGRQRLPTGATLLAGNHSGTAFPYDAMVLHCLLWRREGMPDSGHFRPVFEKALSFSWWMRPFGLDNFWRRGGGVDMTFDNFDRLLARGERVLYFPEGVPGIGKGFQRRYQLQRFSSSFAILAARHRVPVSPLYIINAEWVIPFNFTIHGLNRFMRRRLGIPFFPLPAGLLTPLFPFLFYLALPARMVFVIGEPIDVAAMARGAGLEVENLTLDEGRELAARVRDLMQPELDRHVERYGRRPYQARLLRKQIGAARGRRRYLLPFLWPWLFIQHHRDRSRPARRNRLHGLLRDWDLIGYYLPLGWFFLALTRRLRRPPDGYRGLSRDQRREREGAFVWNLAERPLPPPSSGGSRT